MVARVPLQYPCSTFTPVSSMQISVRRLPSIHQHRPVICPVKASTSHYGVLIPMPIPTTTPTEAFAVNCIYLPCSTVQLHRTVPIQSPYSPHSVPIQSPFSPHTAPIQYSTSLSYILYARMYGYSTGLGLGLYFVPFRWPVRIMYCILITVTPNVNHASM
jgi:hypothetical protein